MHVTGRCLLQIKPLSGASVSRTTLRLPPTGAEQPKARIPRRKVFSETAKVLLTGDAKHRRTVDPTAETPEMQKEWSKDKAVLATVKKWKLSKLPDNVRIEVADKAKTAFWKISRPERQQLRQLLKEY